MARRVIIPAAGRAIRFGGCPKELLPIALNECCLTRAVRMAKELGEPVIITSREKQMLHEHILRESGVIADCVFIQQRTTMFKEMWGAVQEGLQRGVGCALILADTVTSIITMPDSAAKIHFGVFETDAPQRFSVVQNSAADGQIVIRTKENLTGPQFAWGVVLWDAEVTNFFLDNTFEHYDRAFEAAAKKFGGDTFRLSYYFDLGTFPSYLEFLNLAHGSSGQPIE